MLAFCLLLGAAGASAADASFFGLIKLQQFAQAPGASPAPLVSNGFSFQAFVVASTNHAVTNATVAFRSVGVTVTKTLSPVIDGLGLRYEEKFDTQAALDAAYPPGGGFSVVTYTNTLHTVNDGVRAANLTFWLFPPLVSVTSPGVPNVANLNEAQDIDTSSDFTLRWNNLGTVLTLVQLTVLDASSNLVFATPIPFQEGALNGTSNAMLIPAHTFPVNARLEGHLTVANPGLPNTNAYPGAVGVPARANDLVFPLATRSVPAPLLSVTALTGGLMEVRLTGATNHVHRIEATDDFARWQMLAETNALRGEMTVLDPVGPGSRRRFYRGTTER